MTEALKEHIHCIHLKKIAHIKESLYECCRCSREFDAMPWMNARLASE